MNISDNILDIDVVILAGGLGTRLQPLLKNKPKCLVSINGTAFIDILLDSYISHGITRFVICVGYLKDQIIDHLKGKENCEIIFSIEDHPIGTGGAIKKAKRYINSKMFIIANGDSICNIDYLKVIKFHKHNNSDFSMVLSENDSRDDAGNVKIDKDNKIISFHEKNGESENLINSGVYILQYSCLKYMPDKESFSLEHDYFPLLITLYPCRCYGFPVNKKVYDIGTPERLHKYLSINLDSK